MPTLDTFIASWKEDQTAYAIMIPEQFEALNAQNFPMQEVDRDSRRVIVKHPEAAQ